MNRIGIYGGTFDPIHLAHLVLAERACEQLELSRLLFLPAAIPPHKQSWTITDGKARLEMVEMAVAGNPRFEACDIELARRGVSYTVDTLRELGAKFPDAEFVLLVGSDTLREIRDWRLPDDILALARVAVAERPGAIIQHDFPPDRILRVEMPQLDISSTEIRDRVRRGLSIRYIVPPGVEAYIQAHGLYREPVAKEAD